MDGASSAASASEKAACGASAADGAALASAREAQCEHDSGAIQHSELTTESRACAPARRTHSSTAAAAVASVARKCAQTRTSITSYQHVSAPCLTVDAYAEKKMVPYRVAGGSRSVGGAAEWGGPRFRSARYTHGHCRAAHRAGRLPRTAPCWPRTRRKTRAGAETAGRMRG